MEMCDRGRDRLVGNAPIRNLVCHNVAKLGRRLVCIGEPAVRVTIDPLGSGTINMVYDGSMLGVGGLLWWRFLYRYQGFAIREDGGANYVV